MMIQFFPNKKFLSRWNKEEAFAHPFKKNWMKKFHGKLVLSSQQNNVLDVATEMLVKAPFPILFIK
ncbi:hypothetical protein CW304_07500 [Bacillus sp. UFRGS-B20]|nr:hypothetical protein CW304_07500 [Bacillus sp. UFRGS-B20]